MCAISLESGSFINNGGGIIQGSSLFGDRKYVKIHRMSSLQEHLMKKQFFI